MVKSPRPLPDRTNTAATVAFGLFVASLFFGYRPALSFGMSSGVTLKLGLPILFAVVFVITAAAAVIRERQRLIRNIGVRLFGAFALLNAVSVLWSANRPRALFETGLVWLLFAVFVAVLALFPALYASRGRLRRVIYVGALSVCAFAWWQIIGDALGVSPSFTLLPLPYRSLLFGFARPTAFALEPQFLANALIVPLLLALNDILRSRRAALPVIVLIAGLATVITTISRGGILALAVGGIVVLAAAVAARVRPVRYAGLAAAGLAALATGITLIGVGAALDTRDTITAGSAVTGTVRHLSFGKIDLKDLLVPPVATQPAPAADPRTVGQSAAAPPPARQEVSVPVYVYESTDSRVQMSNEAVKLWLAGPRNFLIGIGTGGFGATIHAANPDYALNSIVNNEYLQVASELGAVGLAVFLALLLLPVVVLARRRIWPGVAVLLAFYTQWFFFSGNINAFQLWVCLAGAYGFIALSARQPEGGRRRTLLNNRKP